MQNYFNNSLAIVRIQIIGALFFIGKVYFFIGAINAVLATLAVALISAISSVMVIQVKEHVCRKGRGKDAECACEKSGDARQLGAIFGVNGGSTVNDGNCNELIDDELLEENGVMHKRPYSDEYNSACNAYDVHHGAHDKNKNGTGKTNNAVHKKRFYGTKEQKSIGEGFHAERACDGGGGKKNRVGVKKEIVKRGFLAGEGTSGRTCSKTGMTGEKSTTCTLSKQTRDKHSIDGVTCVNCDQEDKKRGVNRLSAKTRAVNEKCCKNAQAGRPRGNNRSSASPATKRCSAPQCTCSSSADKNALRATDKKTNHAMHEINNHEKIRTSNKDHAHCSSTVDGTEEQILVYRTSGTENKSNMNRKLHVNSRGCACGAEGTEHEVNGLVRYSRSDCEEGKVSAGGAEQRNGVSEFENTVRETDHKKGGVTHEHKKKDKVNALTAHKKIKKEQSIGKKAGASSTRSGTANTTESIVTIPKNKKIKEMAVEESITYDALVRQVLGSKMSTFFFLSNLVLDLTTLVVNLKVSYNFLEEILKFDAKLILGTIFFSTFLMFDKGHFIVGVGEAIMIVIFIGASVIEHLYHHTKVSASVCGTTDALALFHALHNTAFLIWSFYTQPFVLSHQKKHVILFNALTCCTLTSLGIIRHLTFLKTNNHFLTVPYMNDMLRLLIVVLQLLTFSKLINTMCTRRVVRISIFVFVFVCSLFVGNFFYLKALFFLFGSMCMFVVPFGMHVKCYGVGWNGVVGGVGVLGVVYGALMVFTIKDV